jgi:hypothetical protein
MTILTDLNAFLTTKSIANIKYNFYDGLDDCVTLWQYGGSKDKFFDRFNIQISVKNKAMSTAESTVRSIYNNLYPKTIDQENFITLNTRKYKIEALQTPFYLEKDEQNRHTYVFNIEVTAKRS